MCLSVISSRSGLCFLLFLLLLLCGGYGCTTDASEGLAGPALSDHPPPLFPSPQPSPTTPGIKRYRDRTTPYPGPTPHSPVANPVLPFSRTFPLTVPLVGQPSTPTTEQTDQPESTQQQEIQRFDSTHHTVRPPFLWVWQQAASEGNERGRGFGVPRSAPLWLDNHLVQFFDAVLLEQTTGQTTHIPASSLSALSPLTGTTSITPTGTTPISPAVSVWAQPPGWQHHVPADLLTLDAAPQRASLSAGGEQGSYGLVVTPLQPVTLTLHIEEYSGPAEIRFYDARQTMMRSTTVTVEQGKAQVPIFPRGRLGSQWALALVDERVAGANSAIWHLEARTALETGQPDLDLILPTVRNFLHQDVVSYELDGATVRGYRSPDNPLLWLRDHVYQGRGFRYFEQDVTSLLDAFRQAQRPDGSFPDVLSHPALGVVAHRMETESDLEYLFVQGVYEAWQATGNDSWLEANMDAMKRGIAYITSDPLRWDDALGLVRRPYTIDTWDFQVGPSTRNPHDPDKPSPRHWIDDQTRWGIFHGDNTGLAYALKLLERIERGRGNDDAAYRLRKQRDALMDRLNALSWNGPYYTHFVLPDGSLPQVEGVDTAAQLSLSNALALNRKVLHAAQQRDILETYYRRRDFDRAFAEWYSIDPPFPAGVVGMGGGKGEQPGEYVNGGIMPLVGGELSRGAFGSGFESYGFDILRRYGELLRLTGSSSYLWYYPDGRPGRSGEHTLATDGWGSSAMLGALMEGAAGIEDQNSRYRQITLSPRWSAHPDIQQVFVVARYGASDGYVAYRWSYEREQQCINLNVTGSWEQAHVRLLLPPEGRDAQSRTLLVNGSQADLWTKEVGSGYYAVFGLEGGNAEVALCWKTDRHYSPS